MPNTFHIFGGKMRLQEIQVVRELPMDELCSVFLEGELQTVTPRIYHGWTHWGYWYSVEINDTDCPVCDGRGVIFVEDED